MRRGTGINNIFVKKPFLFFILYPADTAKTGDMTGAFLHAVHAQDAVRRSAAPAQVDHVLFSVYVHGAGFCPDASAFAVNTLIRISLNTPGSDSSIDHGTGAQGADIAAPVARDNK